MQFKQINNMNNTAKSAKNRLADAPCTRQAQVTEPDPGSQPVPESQESSDFLFQNQKPKTFSQLQQTTNAKASS